MNRYIYVGNDQAAGPLEMEEPKFYNQVQYEIDCEIWNKHLKSLPRIDIVGEHSFLDGQILEEGELIIQYESPDGGYWYNYEAVKQHKQFHLFKPIAIPLKQVQKEKDFEPGARNINGASVATLACTAGKSIGQVVSDGELFYNRSVMNPYPTDSQSETAYKKGFTEAWQHIKQAIAPEQEDARNTTIYIASKTKHADKWLALRDKGYNIRSSWIDEAGSGDSIDLRDLCRRCIQESIGCDAMIVYREEGDYLKGAFIEMGIALAVGRVVYLVGPVLPECSVFTHSSRVFQVESVEHAIAAINGHPLPNSEQEPDECDANTSNAPTEPMANNSHNSINMEEVKGNATQQGWINLPMEEFKRYMAHAYHVGAVDTYTEKGANEQGFTSWFNEVAFPLLNSEQGVQESDTTMPNHRTEPSHHNSFTEEDLLELNEHLRQENKTLIERIKELEEENRYLKTSITH